MRLIDKPNLLTAFILGFVLLVAGGYSIITYTHSLDQKHYAVDANYNLNFNFDQPDKVVLLPNDLKEISGLAPWTSENEVLAIQDEKGMLFILQTDTGEITAKFQFGKDRDYEGVAIIGNRIFILENNGDIHHTRFKSVNEIYDAKQLKTGFSKRNDTEGLCYDPVTELLLIVPKEQELNPGEGEKYRHGIYGYNLADSTMAPQPLYYVDEQEIGEIIYGKKARYSFKPSGIAVDPITADIYLLAAVGRILVIINRESEVKHIELLKEKVFRQPEGLTFNAAGDLFISSEGKGEKGIVATFKRRNSLK